MDNKVYDLLRKVYLKVGDIDKNMGIEILIIKNVFDIQNLKSIL